MRKLRRTTVLTTAAMMLVVVAGPQAAQAAPSVDINPVDQGWIDVTGLHTSANDNYCVGGDCGNGGTHNFFIFDLPATGYGVVAATIVIPNALSQGDAHPYVLREVKSSPAAVSMNRAAPSAAGQAVYEDLGDGTEFARMTPSPLSQDPIQMGFNPRGLLYLTRHDGERVTFGGEQLNTQETDYFLGGSPVNDVEFYYYWGERGELSINAPARVDRGDRARVSGRLVAADEACVANADLEIKFGNDEFNDSTNAEGRYVFSREVRRKTKIEVFFTGNNCAPDLVNKAIRLR